MKFDTKEFSRRTFIKGSLAAGAALGLGTALDLSGSPFQAAKAKGDSKIVHSACPRNCYDTCSILSTVEDGVLKRVEGDKANTYTRGRLCAKGFSYTRSVYSPDRIKYPMRQSKRGGGRWERISWPDAFDIIAKKILAIKKEYGNTLPICLDKYSGNFNLLNYCVEGMMSSIGHTTRATGTPCWPAGIDAQTFDFGTIWNNDPEDMVNSKYMIIWGANPSWCSVHSMHLVMEAKKPPIKILSPGKVFRSDDDATHSPMFSQMEGLVVDKGITLCDLQGMLDVFVQKLFGEGVRTRLRPSYFPFTEPSVEVDVSCFACGGKGCRLCKGTGWIEILGAGVVNRKVLENCGIDPEVYSGFAFGIGIERVAMLKYGINNIKLLFESDLRVLDQIND